MTGLPSGNLTRYLFKAGGVSFLSGCVLLIHRPPDIRLLEIVLPKPSSRVPSTASGLAIAAASLALLQRVQIDGSEFLLSPFLSAGPWLEELLRREIGMRALPLLSWDAHCSQKQFSGPPELVGYGSGVLKP